MSHGLYRLGRFAARRPWMVIGAWMVIAIAVIGASGVFGRDLEDSFAVPGLDSQDAVDLLTAAGADQAGLTAQVVTTPIEEGLTFSESADARAELAEIQAGLATLSHVLAVSEPTISPDDTIALIRVQYPVLEELSIDDLESLKDFGAEAQEGSPLQIELNGDLFFAFEEPETGVGEMIGIVAAIIILLVAFGSLIAMGLPIGLALFGLALGITSMALVTYLIEVPSWAPQASSMIGLGVGIDYALFLVTRHREFLSRGMTVEEAVGRAVATAGQAVVFAGGTVVIAILGLGFAGVPFMTAFGVVASIIVLIMVLASITLLPAFLGLAGHRINGLRRKKREAKERRQADFKEEGSGWERWGRHVSKNAWPYLIGSTVLLLALASPVLDLRLGFPDEGALPESRTERIAYDLVAEGFGPGINGPFVIAVDISEDPSVVEPLAAAIVADEGIASVAPPEINSDAGVAVLLAFATTSPQDSATRDTITRLRADVFPPVLDDSPARAHVGGQTASFADIGDRVNSRLPLFIAAVVVMSFLLLTLVFRSIVVPLKAATLNLLSIGAAYGVLVMVFQWGWGMSLIGLEATVPIVPFMPHVHVRDPLRPVDGLRSIPPLPCTRGIPGHRRQRRLGHPRHRQHRAGDHLRCLDHDLGLPRLCARRRPRDQDDGPGPGHGNLRRRNHCESGAGAGHHEIDGRRQLVAPRLA